MIKARVVILLSSISIVSIARLEVCRADTVAIDYVLESSVANIVPFTVPNPQGGADITVAPSVTLDSGSFVARFFGADSSGTIADGTASMIGMEFEGSIVIELSSSIVVFGFPVPVSATISGPLAALQTGDSTGTLAGLSLYAETSPGDYDFVAGPLGCRDSVGGLFCAAIQTGLGVEFPLAEVASTGPLPFAGGTFAGLNPPSGSAGGSSVSAQINFSFPLADGVEFGVAVDTNWAETGRMTFVPEPGVGGLLAAAAAVALWRRRLTRA